MIALPDGSLAPVTFTFKGGTSLSRVFGIVERFSEDVDLLAEFPAEASLSARHKILKAVDDAVRSHLSLENNRVTVGSSTKGVKRYTTYAYPSATHDPSLKEGVLLELGSRVELSRPRRTGIDRSSRITRSPCSAMMSQRGKSSPPSM